MALGVVDLFEVIQVEYQAASPVELLVGQVGQVATVEGSGKQIPSRQVVELLLLDVLGRDVLRMAQHVGRSRHSGRWH